jgi:signal transduction histidine kinase
MSFDSIRWRLPASYAAVALLAALLLGSLMLLVLNGYYTRQERNFLLGNAEAARPAVEQILKNHLPGQALEDQIKGLAFLSQAQIRVLDANGNPLADSGAPTGNQVVSLSGDTGGMFVLGINSGTVISATNVQAGAAIPVNAVGTPAPVLQGTRIITGQTYPASVDTIVPISASPFGYEFVASQPGERRRSSQVVRVPLLSTPGSLEISNGPAFGMEILRSVALAWLASGIVAVILAGLVGIIASRQVTQPVLALTEAARRMQYGDLSSRAVLGGGQQVREFSALAQTFNQMAQRVEDTISALRVFVSDAAHELNTPLTALRTNLELALNEPDGRQQEIYITRAVEQNLRLERLASGLLDLSRIEAAQTTPEFKTLDLTRLTAETGGRFASRADQAERTFTLNLPTSTLYIAGNTLQLQRMLDNLLENALKFTPPGGTIQLSLEDRDGQAVLCVADSGIGIPVEDLPHLFERFHRGRNSAEYSGTGLGLSIVKAVVDLHGGQVEVHSAGRGQGSQFYVRLATH